MLAIDENDIHLWYVPVNAIQHPDSWAAYQALMNDAERAKNSRYVFAKDRKLHLLTRALVRTTLSNYLPDIAPRDWLFTENQYGKPHVSMANLAFPIRFNVSHTEKMVVMAVMRCQEVGVDIESLERKIATDDLAKSVFSPLEYQQLKALRGEDFKQRFFELWTLKEAYIKARGKGLSIPLESFSFSFSQAADIAISFDASCDDRDPASWAFKQITLLDHYLVSIATKSTEAYTRYKLYVRQGIA